MQRVAQVAADVEAVDEEDLEALDARLAQALELVLGDLLVDLEEDLAGLLVDRRRARATLPTSSSTSIGQAIEVRLLQLADRRRA